MKYFVPNQQLKPTAPDKEHRGKHSAGRNTRPTRRLAGAKPLYLKNEKVHILASIKKIILLCLFYVIILLTNLYGQINITFKLDMEHLIDQHFYSPENGEKIFVRGSFNQWQGENYELKRQTNNCIFSGTFNVNSNIGDTLEYKFILKKAENQIYWEKNPNPENSNNGNRKLIITQTTLFLPITKFDYDEYINYPIIFSKDKLQKDYTQMRKVLEETHPALYDYIEKDSLDSLFDYYYSKINTPLKFNDYYKILSSVIAQIGCGHTKLWIPSDYWNTVPKRLFPLKILLSHNKVFVCDHYSSSIIIPIGSEILSINKLPIQEIVKTLESITSSDGQIQSFKSKSVEKNFAKKYALYYGYPESFNIQYIIPGESILKEIAIHPVDFETINKNPVRGNKLSFQVLENISTAILTINTFIYYDQLEMFKSFIDSTFNVIEQKKVKNLVMDLRGNDGGDPFCASYLFSYIAHTQAPYFAKSYGKYAPLAEPIPLAQKNFQGNLFTLIDGSGFSTTGHFCALLKYHKIGKFVGTETGATFTCTGNVRYLNLKNTGLILGTAREQRYSAAVENMDREAGIFPEYPVEQSQNDLVAGKDTVFDFVLSLIHN